MNVRRVESQGSIWLLDDGLGRYIRMPKTERPREPAEHGDARAGALQDLVWHAMVGWQITGPDGQVIAHDGTPRRRVAPDTLCIERDDDRWTIAPNAAVIR